ncbi:hypothetical protein LVJ94_48905 [Pendulispora rubella]|uniref:Uncharacterized protein n=1 Tax=Pendulispora rubella TaxID=2741070 RepID=A0ABZ2L229_9BACT
MSVLPPEDELRRLIALEKCADDDPEPVRANLSARLTPLLDARPSALRSPRGRIVRWSIGSFVAGAAAGAVAHAAFSTPDPRVEVRYVDRVVTVERPVDAGASPPPEIAPAPSTKPARPSAPVTAAVDTDLARERQLIDKARSALVRGDAPAALFAVEEHANAFPRGQLAEMREAVAVQALAKAGRDDLARARAKRFHQTFPASVFGPVVDDAISSIP